MRPYVILNCAMKQRVRELRRNVNGIMVGINTVLVDDPHLTASEHKEYNPVRIVIDSVARTPVEAEVLDGRARTVIVVSKRAPSSKIEALAKKAEVLVSGTNRVDLEDALSILYKKGVEKLLLEGGGELNRSMLDLGLVDEIFVTVAPVIVGEGVKLIEGELRKKIKLSLVGIRQYRNQVVLHYVIK
ncbi:MAG: hypothetical protein A7315_10780 [Candidatus Altiarchaeales archaeon WOR_SM1_79]|nr:MAG: hypothetical protein A7315_10780 [Candidatus Altiarchaeales archaeon WOR_SM1_79]